MVRHAFCADVKKMFFASVHFKRNTFTLEFHSMIKDKKNTQNKNGFHLCVKKHQWNLLIYFHWKISTTKNVNLIILTIALEKSYFSQLGLVAHSWDSYDK